MNNREGLEQRIAELERDKEELEYALKTYESAVDLKDKRIEELYNRIAELKRQLPIVVTPKKGTDFYFCECGCVVGYSERYCGQCGSKLNWR